MSGPIKINRGSDKRMRFTWTDSEGAAVALTNPRVFDASNAIESRLTVETVDLSGGIFEVFIEGTDPMALGLFHFRVAAENSSGDSISSERIAINVV